MNLMSELLPAGVIIIAVSLIGLSAITVNILKDYLAAGDTRAQALQAGTIYANKPLPRSHQATMQEVAVCKALVRAGTAQGTLDEDALRRWGAVLSAQQERETRQGYVALAATVVVTIAALAGAYWVAHTL